MNAISSILISLSILNVLIFKAFKGETDESIEYKDAFQDAKESGKALTKEQKENLSSEEKKRLRKELREERKKDTTDGFFKRLFGGDDDTK